MKLETIKKINFFLSALSNYMKQHSGDILIDYATIMERLESRGEIEMYLAKQHFDTEERFERVAETSTLEAREYARKQGWGEYNILLKVKDDRLIVSVMKRDENVPYFPIEHCYTVDEWENYDIINQYGKRQFSLNSK